MFMGTALTTALSRVTKDSAYLKESVRQERYPLDICEIE